MPWSRLPGRVLGLQSHETGPVAMAFGYFFCLLASYYLLRPVRDEMGIRAGVEDLQWLFTATFLVMLALTPAFGRASAALPRKRLIPGVYVFFGASLLLFYLLFVVLPGNPWPARGFYVWISVYNLFVVSVFWSFMTDVFDRAQGKRLFGLISAGGSLGAIAGPAAAAVLAQQLATEALLPAAALVLGGALWAVLRLGRSVDPAQHPGERLAGSAWEGVRLLAGSRRLQGIAVFIWLYTTLSTFLYFQQAHIVAAAFPDSADRTAVFALIDLAVNSLTIGLQLFVSARLMQWLGVGPTLAALPLLLAGGFMLLALSPVIGILIAVQVIRRAGNYGITRPAREVLFTGVDRASRYKAKNVIDTLIYRGGDALAGWLFTGLKGLGLGLGGIAALAVPLALGWAWLGWRLGRGTPDHLSGGTGNDPQPP